MLTIVENAAAVLVPGEILPEDQVFSDISEMPLDVHPTKGIEANEHDWAELDGDNSILQFHLEGIPVPSAVPPTRDTAPLAVVRPRALYVPLRRTMKKGMRGKDVLALQRAMAVAGFRKWGVRFNGLFGDGLRTDVKQLQARFGLTRDGVYGPTTHSYGRRYFDAYGAYLMGQVKVAPTAEDYRQRIVNAAMHGYYKRAYIHYTQSSWRMYGVRNRIRIPGIPRYEDCSSFATWCYWHAGRPDPNGFGFNGQGYTGTLAAHGRRPSVLRAADLIFYGGGFPYGHVTIYIGNGRCVSHGNEYGPQLLSAYYRTVSTSRTYF